MEEQILEAAEDSPPSAPDVLQPVQASPMILCNVHYKKQQLRFLSRSVPPGAPARSGFCQWMLQHSTEVLTFRAKILLIVFQFG
jgi:hypothetical protein